MKLLQAFHGGTFFYLDLFAVFAFGKVFAGKLNSFGIQLHRHDVSISRKCLSHGERRVAGKHTNLKNRFRASDADQYLQQRSLDASSQRLEAIASFRTSRAEARQAMG